MRKILSWALGLVLMAGAATATPVTLQYLIDNAGTNEGTIQSGDKTFSNFTAVLTPFGEGLITPTNLTGINVTPISSGGLFGIQLAGGIYVACAPGANCPTSWDLNVSWDVTAGSGYLINGVDLSFNGTSSLAPPYDFSIAQVVETVSVGTQIVGSGMVMSSGPMSVFIPLNDAYTSIRITKDILLVAGAVISEEGGQRFAFASLSDVDQYYHQIVPEPGTYALIGAGLLGLGLLRRRLS
jgi:hypothetical protein